MSKRKHIFTYRPATSETSDVVRRNDYPVLPNLRATFTKDPPRFIIEDSDEEEPWEIEKSGCTSTPIWAFAYENRFPGLVLESITLEFRDALLPEGSKKEMALSGAEWLDGKAWYRYTDVEDEKNGVYINVLCLAAPSKKLVSLTVEIGQSYPLREYIHAFFEAVFAVERALCRARALRQLLQAFRTQPRNDGFITRSIREMHAAIAPPLGR